VDAYNVTVQRQLTNSISLEVAYVGSKGTHGFAGNGPNYDVNPVSMALYGVIDPNTITPTNPNAALRPKPAQTAVQACLWGTPGTHRTSAGELPSTWATTTAMTPPAPTNAFEVKVEKRFARACNSSLTIPISRQRL